MKESFLLIKYYIDYARMDKRTYKLLSVPSEERDEALLDECIQTKDWYAAKINEIRERHAHRPAAWKKAVAFAACVLAFLLAGTGIAEAAGIHIWKEIFSFGTKQVILQGTDGNHNMENAKNVYVDSAEGTTHSYGSLYSANQAIGTDTFLRDDALSGYTTTAPVVKTVDDISYLDVTYKRDGTYFAVRVTVINGDENFLTSVTVDTDGYAEKEIAGLECSVNRTGNMQSCIFQILTDQVKCIYSIRTNASDAELEKLVESIAAVK